MPYGSPEELSEQRSLDVMSQANAKITVASWPTIQKNEDTASKLIAFANPMNNCQPYPTYQASITF